ncbi:hypothetical protein KUCAC02_004965, partial [Chaenocephalus aceratus]
TYPQQIFDKLPALSTQPITQLEHEALPFEELFNIAGFLALGYFKPQTCRVGSGEPGSLGERGWDKSGRLAKHPLPRRVDALKSVRITPTPIIAFSSLPHTPLLCLARVPADDGTHKASQMRR